jgi:hypothetical protein
MTVPTDSLKVKENKDGTFTMEWDREDPMWSWLNTLSEEEITKIISDHANSVLKDNTLNSVIDEDSLSLD